MVYKALLKNNHGATLIYILAAFLIISFIGVTMIKQSHHEMKSSSDFSSMTTADQAARSGIEATRQYLENDVVATRTMLNNFIRNRNTIWILGDTSNTVQVNTQTSFRTKLMNFAFDSTNYTNDFEITIRCEGFGRANSKKTIISVLDINGLEWASAINNVATTIPTNALHLGSGADELNTPITVHGDTYIQGGGYMYGGSGTFSEFYGDFRVDTSSSMFRIKYANFHGPVYCAGDIDMTGATSPSTFDSGFGAEGLVKVGSNCGPDVKNGNVYLNGSYDQTNGSSEIMDLNSKGRLYGWEPNTKFATSSRGTGLNRIADNAIATTLETDSMDIKDSLSIPDTVPKVPINLTQIRAKAIDVYLDTPGPLKVGTTGEDMNDYYESLSSSDLYDDEWLVLNYTGANGTPFETGGDGFEYKVIWLIENKTLQAAEKFYEHTESGITFIYVGTGGAINPGLGGCDLFRGFIYLNSPGTGTNIFKGKTGSEFKGGIYNTDTTRKFRLEGFGAFTVRYDGSVISALAGIGLFDTTMTAVPVIIDSLVQVDPISTIELGLQF